MANAEKTSAGLFVSMFFFGLEAHFYDFRDVSATLALSDARKKKRKQKTSPHVLLITMKNNHPNSCFRTFKNHGATKADDFWANETFQYDAWENCNFQGFSRCSTEPRCVIPFAESCGADFRFRESIVQCSAVRIFVFDLHTVRIDIVRCSTVWEKTR